MTVESLEAGMLLGITNTFGTVPGVLAPIAVGYLTKDVSFILPNVHYVRAISVILYHENTRYTSPY